MQKVLIFAGCMSNYKLIEVKQSLTKLFKRANIDFSFFESEKCCGFPLFSSGFTKSAKSLANYFINNKEKIDGNTIVTPCPGCYKAFKVYYPKIVKSKINAMHHSELILELIKNKKLVFKPMERDNAIKVAYHDPCHLAELGIIEEPRKILENLPNLKLVEFSRSREKTQCCGGGSGVVWVAYPRLSLSMAEERVREALSLEADVLLSSCPLCVINLETASRRLNANIKVMELCSFVANFVR